ncbi:DUF924 family protein [Roseateles sp.]|jgi:uncharacterized protein (DUF924 family)/predicted GNAT family acetyltransferase|uniref:DUF924 family protein n=1 Tax=Roseateles sp. TaxID=1971397 RepID=UPI0037C521FA
MEITHNEHRQCFETWVDGHRCELDYRIEPGRLIITHTGTAPELRGRGLAALLAEQALRWAAPLGLHLVPACSYVQVYIERHPQWLRLLEPSPVQQVLNFWFGPLSSESDGQPRVAWFKKDESFDDEVRQRFGALLEQALAGGLQSWDHSSFGTLAHVLLLDQFTRNAFRGQPRAFAGDAQALRSALALIDRGLDTKLSTLQRWFIYLPLEHAEDLALQQRCVALFEALAGADASLAGALDYAQRHLAVIESFGRFPHRNAILGRPSSAAELDYLAQPGSGF